MMAQERAYQFLERAKSLMVRQSKSVAKMQINWHMGKIAFNLGLNNQGERLIRKARKGLRELGEFQEFALASLDLAALYLLFGDTTSFEALVRDTNEYLVQAIPDSEMLRILSNWRSRLLRSPEEFTQLRRQVASLGKEAAASPHAQMCE